MQLNVLSNATKKSKTETIKKSETSLQISDQRNPKKKIHYHNPTSQHLCNNYDSLHV